MLICIACEAISKPPVSTNICVERRFQSSGYVVRLPTGCHRLSDKGHTIDRTTCDLCAEWVDACPAEALQIMGRPLSASDLYTEMAADRPFKERSGGGVTLSGGAPLVQQRFVGGISGNLQG